MAKVSTTDDPGGPKVLARTERRYVAKRQGEGRSATWGVYDRERGSWPVHGPVWGGAVQQTGHSEASAQAEADRLEEGR